MKKKLLSILLAVLMVVSLLPTVSLAAGHDLTVTKNGGEAASEGSDYSWKNNELNIKTSGLTVSGSSETEYIRVIGEGNISLTLDNVSIRIPEKFVILSEATTTVLTINIKGQCTLQSISAGIMPYADMEIVGERGSKLSITVPGIALYSEKGSITVRNCEFDIMEVDTNPAINAFKNITFENCDNSKIRAVGESGPCDLICCNDLDTETVSKITLDDCDNMTITATNNGIYNYGNIEIKDCNNLSVTATSCAIGSNGIWDLNEDENRPVAGGNVVITNSSVTANCKGEDPIGMDSTGICAAGKLTIKNSTVNAYGSDVEYYEYAMTNGIYCAYMDIINSTVTAKSGDGGDWSNGISAYISGNADPADNYAINISGKKTKVNAYGGIAREYCDAMFAHGDIRISDGAVVNLIGGCNTIAVEEDGEDYMECALGIYLYEEDNGENAEQSHCLYVKDATLKADAAINVLDDISFENATVTVSADDGNSNAIKAGKNMDVLGNSEVFAAAKDKKAIAVTDTEINPVLIVNGSSNTVDYKKKNTVKGKAEAPEFTMVNNEADAKTVYIHLPAADPIPEESIEYAITVENDGNGTAKAQVGGADAVTAVMDATVMLMAVPNDGYIFKEWQIVSGLEAGAITDNSFTMPANDVQVKAIFEEVQDESDFEEEYPYVAVYSVNTSENVNASVSRSTYGKIVTFDVAPGFVPNVFTAKGAPIPVNMAADGSYWFAMPGSGVTITAACLFGDVQSDEYFYDAVLWAAGKGITNGIDLTHFAPYVPVTRAQAVTFLWRAAGCPEPSGNAAKFTDVEVGSYYEKAVAWAIEQGITKGTSPTEFSPDMVCTRAHIVTFLARFAGVKDADTASVFSDVKPTDYYAAAVKWAKDNKVTEGTSETLFSPNLNCTRGQVVTFLWRWMGK